MLERYVYDPFGAVTVLSGSWTVIGSSAYCWQYLHQGGRLDRTSGLYHFRNRDYSPTLGRWMVIDPIRYAAGDVNQYRYLSNGPADRHDPFGLQDLPKELLPQSRPFRDLPPGGSFGLLTGFPLDLTPRREVEAYNKWLLDLILKLFYYKGFEPVVFGFHPGPNYKPYPQLEKTTVKWIEYELVEKLLPDPTVCVKPGKPKFELKPKLKSNDEFQYGDRLSGWDGRYWDWYNRVTDPGIPGWLKLVLQGELKLIAKNKIAGGFTLVRCKYDVKKKETVCKTVAEINFGIIYPFPGK